MFSYKLPNGMRVVGESMPGYRSVSMGVFINAGSVYETEGENGAAHFIEHMLFKGTKTRTASQIAEEMDAVGGNLNAFTSKECTCFYGRVLGDRVSTLSEILADLITNSLLSEEDIEREKGVVCEEIMMTEDTPEDLVTETAVAGFYEGDPLERPILGTVDSVRAFTREGLVGYMERLYRPENTVVSAAGNFDKDELIASLEAGFGGMKAGESAEVDFGLHRPAKRLRFIKKDIEQAHICICLPGFRKDTKESYAQMILSNAFGGSMSSRLFQRIREERGLAYSVYSYPTAFRQSGFMTLYAGTGAENAATVTEMMLEQIDILKRDGVTEEELERSKKQIIAGFLMAQESTSARSSAIGRAELLRGKQMTEDEVIERINSVAMDDIYGILPIICNTEDVSAAFVGRIGGSEKRLRELMRG